jgi:hypothetical protein
VTSTPDAGGTQRDVSSVKTGIDPVTLMTNEEWMLSTLRALDEPKDLPRSTFTSGLNREERQTFGKFASKSAYTHLSWVVEDRRRSSRRWQRVPTYIQCRIPQSRTRSGRDEKNHRVNKSDRLARRRACPQEQSSESTQVFSLFKTQVHRDEIVNPPRFGQVL